MTKFNECQCWECLILHLSIEIKSFWLCNTVQNKSKKFLTISIISCNDNAHSQVTNFGHIVGHEPKSKLIFYTYKKFSITVWTREIYALCLHCVRCNFTFENCNLGLYTMHASGTGRFIKNTLRFTEPWRWRPSSHPSTNTSTLSAFL